MNIEEFKQTLPDIETIIGDYAEIENGFCCCPIHGEKTPSLKIYKETQSFYCYGACSLGGDSIKFIQEIEGLDFIEAVKFIGEKYNIEVPEFEGDGNKLYEAVEKLADYYQNKLTGSIAEKYLKERNINENEIEAFNLGYCPKKSPNMPGHIIDIYLELGFLQPKYEGGYQWSLANRLIFPIKNKTGSFVGFSGRLIEGEGTKYKLTKTTDIFQKKIMLYNLYRARRYAKEKVYLVEGFFDVIAFYRQGYRNVVASLGTGFSKEQNESLKAKEIVIAFDGDKAGQKAAMKIVNNIDKKDISFLIFKDEDPFDFVSRGGKITDLQETSLRDMIIPKDDFKVGSETITNYLKLITGKTILEIELEINFLSEKYKVSRSVLWDEYNKHKEDKDKVVRSFDFS